MDAQHAALSGDITCAPEEVLLHIFSFLDAPTLCRAVGTVCVEWYRMHVDDGLWAPLYDRRFGIHKELTVPLAISATTSISTSTTTTTLPPPLVADTSATSTTTPLSLSALEADIRFTKQRLADLQDDARFASAVNLTRHLEDLEMQKSVLQRQSVSLILKASKDMYHWYELFKERIKRGGKVRVQILRSIMHILQQNEYRQLAWSPSDSEEFATKFDFDSIKTKTETEIVAWMEENMQEHLNQQLSFSTKTRERGFREDLDEYIPMTMVPKSLSLNDMKIRTLLDILVFTAWAEGSREQRDWILERKIGLPASVYQTIYF
eukprot:TRINITY_DN7609_c0_g1_i1.p1 TRINITY_DN7609_c0_g1~~TRINITY_DN7609_c0_g1_i1.p1  ORF type:complete len:321 (+),score=44.16 TRINITY_DN7609_c0_g1_i1:3-965(+)